MTNLKKAITGLLVTGLLAATSVSSAFAGAKAITYSSANINNSAIDTMVSSNDKKINVKSCNADISDLIEKNVEDSIVGTCIFINDSTIGVTGCKADVLSSEEMNVHRSIMNTLINDNKGEIFICSK